MKKLKPQELPYEMPDLSGSSLLEASKIFADLAELHKDKLNVRVYQDYYDEKERYTIVYDREETDAEYQIRVAEEERIKKLVEDREKKQFEELKKKYG